MFIHYHHQKHLSSSPWLSRWHPGEHGRLQHDNDWPIQASWDPHCSEHSAQGSERSGYISKCHQVFDFPPGVEHCNVWTDIVQSLASSFSAPSWLNISPQMANKMGELVGETEQRDAMVAKLHEEAQLQIVLLQHQVGQWKVLQAVALCCWWPELWHLHWEQNTQIPYFPLNNHVRGCS